MHKPGAARNAILRQKVAIIATDFLLLSRKAMFRGYLQGFCSPRVESTPTLFLRGKTEALANGAGQGRGQRLARRCALQYPPFPTFPSACSKECQPIPICVAHVSSRFKPYEQVGTQNSRFKPCATSAMEPCATYQPWHDKKAGGPSCGPMTARVCIATFISSTKSWAWAMFVFGGGVPSVWRFIPTAITGWRRRFLEEY